MVLNLNRKQLVELIESMEAKGNDATALRQELAELGPEDTPGPSRRGPKNEDKEETTEERLIRRVGYLFPSGIPYKEIFDYDYRFRKEELIEQCRKAGLGVSGDKKEMAAKLIAKGGYDEGEEVMSMEEKVDLGKQREWEGKPGEVTIPEAYLKGLCHEIVVFTRKERGGSDFVFRCKEYQEGSGSYRSVAWKFSGVVIDTSKLNAQGEVTLARVTYHPEVVLVNIGFMVVQAPEDAAP